MNKRTSKSVLIGKDTGRIVEQKEEIIKFPDINGIWILVNEYSNNLREFFVSSDHFVYYLKDLIENKNYNIAADTVLYAIFNEICDYSWEDDDNTLSDNMDEIKFAEILNSNFKYMYEQYKKNK